MDMCKKNETRHWGQSLQILFYYYYFEEQIVHAARARARGCHNDYICLGDSWRKMHDIHIKWINTSWVVQR